MKTLRYTFVLSAAVLALSACTQNDWTDSSGLPEGKYPLVIEAGGLESVASRATVDGNWEGMTDVAVKVGSEVKKYNVYNNWQTATLSSTDDPFYWTSRNDIEVEAWWPYDAENLENMPPVVVKADQSSWENYINSDYIHAHSSEVKFENPTLVFTHRTACITVTLVGGDGITDVGNAQVMIKGLSTQDGNPSTISTYRDWGYSRAIVAPQTIQAGTKFISVTYKEGEFSYTTKSEINLEVNQRHNYTLRLNGEELELADCTITDWNDEDKGNVEAGITDYFYEIPTNTYWVFNETGLRKWVEHVNAGNWNTNCVLKSDITLPAADESGNNWTAISYFTGVFDGEGHTIRNLNINLPDTEEVGLFKKTERGSTVKNLIIENVNITGKNKVGGLVGYTTGAIVACTVSGEIHGKEYVGGIVGQPYGMVIYDYYASMIGCTFSGKVIGQQNVGSISGGHEKSNITACYSNAYVEGDSEVGGIAGFNTYAGISASYFTGTVVGRGERVGGIVGACYWMSTISACYSTASVTGTTDIGVLVGRRYEGNILNSYWYSEDSGIDALGLDDGGAGYVSFYKVDGTDITWISATEEMNKALGDASQWIYVQTNGIDNPPTIQIKE